MLYRWKLFFFVFKTAFEINKKESKIQTLISLTPEDIFLL